MARPVPHYDHLIDLSIYIQHHPPRQMEIPTVLCVLPEKKWGLVGSDKSADLLIYDVEQTKVARKLETPPGTYKGTDFRRFCFNPGSLFFAGYNSRDSSYSVWSLKDGKVVHHSKGQGMIPPAMCFLEGGKIALCDGPRLNTYSLSGDLMYYTAFSDDIRSLALFSAGSPAGAMVAAAVYRKGIGGSHFHGFRIENGVVVHESEGPYRSKPENPDNQRSISIHEFLNIPGLTKRILVLLEEERTEKRASHDTWEYDDSYTTRLLAIDPVKAKFQQGAVEIPGRFCLEINNSELTLIDEQGRRRLVTGFPFRLEDVDWRFQGQPVAHRSL